MSSMKDACESALHTRIQSGNVLYLLSVADRYNTPKLKVHSMKLCMRVSNTDWLTDLKPNVSYFSGRVYQICNIK